MNKCIYMLHISFLNAAFLTFSAERALTSMSYLQPRKISARLFIEETQGLSEKAKRLYGQAMSYDISQTPLDRSSPITQKIEFDNAINSQLCLVVRNLLCKHSHLQTKHPIGYALWRIWKKNAENIELDIRDFRFVQAQNVIFIAKELAINAKNKGFLKSYCLLLKRNNEIRRIVFPFLYDCEFFDHILFIHCEDVFGRAGIKIDIDELIN